MTGRTGLGVSYLLTLLLLSASAPGATRTWTGAGDSNLWSDAANWDSGVPVAGDDLVFPASETQNDLAGLSIHSLTVDGTQGAITGNSIVLAAGLTAGGRWDIAIPIELGGSQTWAFSYGPAFYPETTLADIDLAHHDLTIVVTGSIVSTMDLALNGDITGTGSLEIQSLGRSAVTVNGQIRSGPVSLEMQNQGQVSLHASNTFDGPLHVRLGANLTRLWLGADDAIPEGAAVEVQSAGGWIMFRGPFSIDVASFDVTGRATLSLAGGVLSSQGVGSPTFAGPVVGPGTIRVTGGSQTFTDNEYPGQFSGSFAVEDGRLILTRNQSGNWGGSFPDAPVSVNEGELGLNGAEVGSIEVQNGALDLFPQTNAPSAPSRCDALQLEGSSRFRTRLDTPLFVGGPVSLGSAELELLDSGEAVSAGEVIPLIDNAGASPTDGIFDGLPEGAEFSAGGVVYRMTYAAGPDGKDVAVVVVSVPPECSSTISPAHAGFPSSGGEGSVAVDTEPACHWTASSPVAWISTSSQGTGDGTAQFTVHANGGPARTATLTIAGQAFTVEQGAAQCPAMTSSNVSIALAPSSPCDDDICPAGEPIAFRVRTSGYDLACATHTFVWDYGDGTVVPGSSVAEHVFEARTEPYPVNVTITNGAQAFETEAIRIMVTDPSGCGSLQFSPPDLPDAYVDRHYAQTITVEGGRPPYTIALKSGSLPRGLTLDDGELAGIPTRTGQYRFTVRAADAAHCEKSMNYTLTVRDAPCPLMIPSQNLFVTYRGDVSRCTEANGRLCVKGEPIHFSVTTAEGYSFSCGAHEMTWELGDGTSGSGNPVIHEFESGGTYSVTVHVANEAQDIVLSVPVEVAKGRRRAMPHR